MITFGCILTIKKQTNLLNYVDNLDNIDHTILNFIFILLYAYTNEEQQSHSSPSKTNHLVNRILHATHPAMSQNSN